MAVVRWIGITLAALVASVLFLDTFGGYFLDGPLGPIPGGQLQGAVSAETDPDWSGTEEVIELEIRPQHPWSLSIWNVVIDGKLYVPSARGASRRWPAAALADPRVRVRTKGQIYERTLVKIDEGELRSRIARKVASRYGFDPEQAASGTSTWYFELAPR